MSFMDYAKKELYVWYQENNKPEIAEFLEPSFLGLLFCEILINNHYGYKIVESDLNELNAFLSSCDGKDYMSKYIKEANSIILNIKESDLYE